MAVESISDRAAFVADFGVAVTGAASFTAIFGNEYFETGNITGLHPVLSAPYDAPVTVLADGDNLTVDSTSYKVRRVEKDGAGWCMIILEEQ